MFFFCHSANGKSIVLSRMKRDTLQPFLSKWQSLWNEMKLLLCDVKSIWIFIDFIDSSHGRVNGPFMPTLANNCYVLCRERLEEFIQSNVDISAVKMSYYIIFVFYRHNFYHAWLCITVLWKKFRSQHTSNAQCCRKDKIINIKWNTSSTLALNSEYPF